MKREISIAFQTDKSPQDYIDLAKLVNNYDFDAVTVYCDAPFHPSFGPLFLMAPYIERARLGTAGVSPARMHPIDMAANIALLDQAAPGGAYLGIVRGAWLSDHGVKAPQKPIQAIREAVDIIRMMHSGGGGYQGEIYQIEDHVKTPYPLPDHDIPALIGSWGPKLLGVGGECADEVKVGGSANPALVSKIQEYVTKGEKRAGREPGEVGIVLGAVSVVDEDREQARALAREEVALYLPVVAKLDPTLDVEPELINRVDEAVKRGDSGAVAGLISDGLLNRLTISGNPGDIITQLEAMFDAGVSRVEIGTPHGLTPERGIQLLGTEVLPNLR